MSTLTTEAFKLDDLVMGMQRNQLGGRTKWLRGTVQTTPVSRPQRGKGSAGTVRERKVLFTSEDPSCLLWDFTVKIQPSYLGGNGNVPLMIFFPNTGSNLQ